ncbi:MAG: DUF6468 domain-containing protein [Pseudorhodoplanes sp.]
MSNVLGMTIEILVALLLLLTIAYCAQLNARLKKLRADEATMKGTIAELVAATEGAQRAIAGLKQTVRECDEGLGERLRSAERFSAEIAAQIHSGGAILDKLARIVGAGRGAPAPDTASDAKAVVARAQAFAERARSRMGGLAA